MNPTPQLHDLGQSLWLGNITRGILTNGTLRDFSPIRLLTTPRKLEETETSGAHLAYTSTNGGGVYAGGGAHSTCDAETARFQMSKTTASNDEPAIDRFKQAAANIAVAQLRDGMVVGLGSGTTATLAVAAIGRRVKEGLRIICIPTSEQTADQAWLLNIPLSTLEDHCAIDVTIDGADEVEEGTLNLIKGGGGNLLREKIVAVASSRMIVVVDESKVTGQLGTHSPLAVEVIPFGWNTTAERLEKVGAHPALRTSSDGGIFLTDGGHYILDCAFGPIDSPRQLQADLDSIVGTVEHGLFIGIASQVLVGGPEGVRTLNRKIDP